MTDNKILCEKCKREYNEFEGGQDSDGEKQFFDALAKMLNLWYE